MTDEETAPVKKVRRTRKPKVPKEPVKDDGKFVKVKAKSKVMYDPYQKIYILPDVPVTLETSSWVDVQIDAGLLIKF